LFKALFFEGRDSVQAVGLAITVNKYELAPVTPGGAKPAILKFL
jgi:hypothetical protein